MEHTAQILAELFVLLLATKIGDELFKRIHQPPIVGEILGGVLVGPAVLGWYTINPETTLFAEIGVVLLLFQVGVETRLAELLRVGGTAASVGALGVVLPFGAGFGIGALIGLDAAGSVFLGAALTATSVGITSRALAALGALNTRTGRVILGAAIIDDVLAMLILAVAVGLAAGEVSAGRIGLLLVMAVAFIAITVLAGTGILRRHRSLLTVPHFAETPFLPGMIVMLGLAALAAWIGLAAIIGAFLAGMVVGESSERHALEEEVAPVAAFFTPFFFGSIGAQVDLAGLASLDTLALLGGVTAVAVLAKFLGALAGGWTLPRGQGILVAWGMVPRGEVGIVVAGLGIGAGAITGSLYSVVVGMAVLTTLIVPPLLPLLVRRSGETSEPAVSSTRGVAADPADPADPANPANPADPADPDPAEG